MNLITKRFNISIRFFAVCGMLIVMAVSIMMLYMYPDDTEYLNETKPTIETIVYTEETNFATEESEHYETTVSIDNDTEVEEEQAEVVLSSTTDIQLESTFNEVDIEIEEETTSTEPEPTTPEIVEEKVLEYKYGRRMTPAVDIEIPTGDNMRNYTEEVDTTNYELIGTYNITGYTPKCVHCCGSDKGITASGVEAIAGYTVATSSNIPFGTTLYIEGYGYYVAEDRGAMSNWVIDIAAPSHDACYGLTDSGVNVYIVPHEEIN